MQFGGYLGVVRRWWFTLLAAMAVGAIAGWLVAGALPPSFRSETRLLVGPINADFDTLRASTELTRTYAEVATTSEVLTTAIGTGGLSLTVEALAEAVESTPNEQARMVTISAELRSPDEAARAADAVAQALITYTSAGAQRPEGELRVVDRASEAPSGAPQRTALIVVLAALGAVLGAMLLVLLIEALDSTVRDTQQVRRLAGSAFLGTVPLPAPGSRSGGPVSNDPRHLELLGDLLGSAKRQPKAILILGADHVGDADEMTEALAAHLAALETRVCVIDASETDREWLPASSPGNSGGPFVIRARNVRDPSVATELRADALKEADVVLINGGSAKGSFGAPLWARAVDRVLLIARVGGAHRDSLLDALHRLTAVAGTPTSVVAATGRRQKGTDRKRRGAREHVTPAVGAGTFAPLEPEPGPGAEGAGSRLPADGDARPLPTVRSGTGARHRRSDRAADPTRRSMT